VKTQHITNYEAAKAERTAFITDWLKETAMPEPACSGWARTALLLVINHSLITEVEKEVEKAALSTFSNNQAYHRRRYWQAVIESRESKQIA
jgi:hypothetical protein